MTELTTAQLQALGISRDDIIEKVIERCVDSIMSADYYDDETGDQYRAKSDVEKQITKLCRQRVDEKVKEIADAHVLPFVSERIENLTLQATNQWGEKTGAPVTFIEYLVKRADNYLTEKVDYNGKSKDENGSSYGWSGTQTRITHMIHQHLHYSIQSAMKDAVQHVNAALSKGLQETVKTKIDEIVSSLKIQMK
jgi:hypothetical protein